MMIVRANTVRALSALLCRRRFRRRNSKISRLPERESVRDIGIEAVGRESFCLEWAVSAAGVASGTHQPPAGRHFPDAN
jgi:hypothetical protein